MTQLSEEDRELWEETAEEEDNEATVEDLLEFIQETLKPWYGRQLIIATRHAEIKAQTLGESVQPHRLENLNRYESHLDRKFQRTLAMLIKLDVRRWHRGNLLSPHQSFGWQWTCDEDIHAAIRVRTEPGRVILTYRHRSNGDDWKDECYPVNLDWSDCNLGGKRPWFLCPAQGCGRRVAKLYGGRIFACRHCYQLAYPCQREEAYDRAARRADKIRERLGWEQGILNGKGYEKPKGMHWKTFQNLNKEHDYYVQFSLAGIATKLNLLS